MYEIIKAKLYLLVEKVVEEREVEELVEQMGLDTCLVLVHQHSMVGQREWCRSLPWF